MKLDDFLVWVQLVNLLLVPLFVYILRLERVMAEISATLKTHVEIDAVQLGAIGRDLVRIEGATAAAHRRLDTWQIQNAPPSG